MMHIPLALAVTLSAAAGPPLAFAATPQVPGAAIGSAARDGATLLLAGGCHADVLTHYVPEFGGAAAHRHRSDCRPVPVQSQRPVDCHREPREHFVPGMGRVYHRHVGPNCDIRVIRRSTSPLPE